MAHAVAVYCSIVSYSQPFGESAMRVALLAVDALLLIGWLKIDLFRSLLYYEARFALDRVYTCFYLLLTAQLHHFEVGLHCAAYASFTAMGLSIIVLLIWACRQLCIRSCR